MNQSVPSLMHLTATLMPGRPLLRQRQLLTWILPLVAVTVLSFGQRADAYDVIDAEQQAELVSRIDAVHSARIVMHATESTARLAGQLSTLLTAMGADQVEQRIVDTVPDSNQIRYYHAADREAGQVVGDVMRLVFDDIAIRDFESFQPSPSEGLVEIWLR